MKTAVLTILTFAMLAVLFWLGRKKTGTRTGKFERDLFRKCHGDRSLAERLIKLERRKNPDLSREKAARYAMESLLRDKR